VEGMSRRIRALLGVVILVISISLLIWAFTPTRKEIRTQPIAPSELQLPFRIDTSTLLAASPTLLEVSL
jgi:hypothetical protein